MATKSDNYISKFRPKSHFFTDPFSLTQSEPQAFGPVSADKFRLTTKFTVSGAKAFAVCKGLVLVQPQTGSEGAVNLIMRPYTQPIAGLNIKYFIYRGLKKDDFFNGDQLLKPTGTTSDFINRINESFIAFHTSTGPDTPLPDFMAKYIGYDPANQYDNLKLSDFFFKQSGYVGNDGETTEEEISAFELPLIDLGASLGTFVSAECGIDIVLNYGDYTLPDNSGEFVFDLAYGRAKETIIDLSILTDDFAKKVKKEQIFQFLDAAAYYGFHSIDGGIVVTDSNGTKLNKKGEEIYNDVVSKFHTKNKIYLYIQSDRTRSYNFYGNYKVDDTGVNSLMIGDTETGLVEAAYGTVGWPLIINESTQAYNDGRNKIFIQFVTDNNENTMLYGQVAEIDNAQHNNFCGPADLILPVVPVDPDFPVAITNVFTKVVILSNPAFGPDNGKINVATFNILLYQGKVYSYVSDQIIGEEATTDMFAEPNFFDDVFDAIDGVPLFKTGEDTVFSTLSSQKLKLINHYYDNTQYGVSAIQTTIVNDVIATTDTNIPTLNRVTYITESIDILNSVISISGIATSDTKSSPSVSRTVTAIKTYKLPEPFYYTVQSFTESTLVVNGLILNASDKSIPDKIILGLSLAENVLLKGLITINNLKNPRLFLVDLFVGNNRLLSRENILYQKYKMGIVGEVRYGKLKLCFPATNVFVYSLDRKYHFSDQYSKYVKEDSLLTLVMDLDISI